MKIRILSIACVATAATLLAACTAVYKNADACEQLMRSKLADKSSDTLKIDHTGVGIDGSRVVVEGAIEHTQTAAELAASDAAAASASAAAASAAQVASVAGAAGAASGVSSASGVSAASAAFGASAASAASTSLAASSAAESARKPAKPKKFVTAAAAECTYHGSVLDVFNWLAPAKFAAPPDEPSSEAAE
ncbi:hypothetical protein PQQ51_08230 [Paraburkholderia xenovorans]|uniref:hypothetical protein n=1 Tax=Paraburkholderia xenovorans TaxID=36873 RepID=UPI0038B9C907